MPTGSVNNTGFNIVTNGDASSLFPAEAGHTHWVMSCSFSPDGSRIVSGGNDGLRLWSVTDNAGQLQCHSVVNDQLVKTYHYATDEQNYCIYTKKDHSPFITFISPAGVQLPADSRFTKMHLLHKNNTAGIYPTMPLVAHPEWFDPKADREWQAVFSD